MQTTNKLRYPHLDVVEYFGLTKYRIRVDELTAICPFLHNGRMERSPSFGINLCTGKWHCFGCGRSGGSLADLAFNIGIPIPEMYRTEPLDKQVGPVSSDIDITESDISRIIDYPENASELLYRRGINLGYDKCKEYSIGSTKEMDRIYFPLFHGEGNLIGWQERLINNANYRWITHTKNSFSSAILFGTHMINPKDNRLFVTESTTDAVKLFSWG